MHAFYVVVIIYLYHIKIHHQVWYYNEWPSTHFQSLKKSTKLQSYEIDSQLHFNYSLVTRIRVGIVCILYIILSYSFFPLLIRHLYLHFQLSCIFHQEWFRTKMITELREGESNLRMNWTSRPSCNWRSSVKHHPF